MKLIVDDVHDFCEKLLATPETKNKITTLGVIKYYHFDIDAIKNNINEVVELYKMLLPFNMERDGFSVNLISLCFDINQEKWLPLENLFQIMTLEMLLALGDAIGIIDNGISVQFYNMIRLSREETEAINRDDYHFGTLERVEKWINLFKNNISKKLLFNFYPTVLYNQENILKRGDELAKCALTNWFERIMNITQNETNRESFGELINTREKDLLDAAVGLDKHTDDPSKIDEMISNKTINEFLDKNHEWYESLTDREKDHFDLEKSSFINTYARVLRLRHKKND